MHLTRYAFVNNMIESKEDKMPGIILFLNVSFQQKISLIPTFFKTILIYITNILPTLCCINYYKNQMKINFTK